MPPTTIKTVILAPPNLFFEGGVTGINLDSTELNGYSGAFFWMQGQGGNGFAVGNNFFAGTSGYINSGYIDFDYPYSVDSLYLQVKTTEGNYQTDPCSKLQITYAPFSGAPVDDNGNQFPVFHGANQGYMYNSGDAPYAPPNTYIGGADFGAGVITTTPLKVQTQLNSITFSAGSSGTIVSTGSVVPQLFGKTSVNYIGGGGYYGAGAENGSGAGAAGFGSGSGIIGSTSYNPDDSNKFWPGFVVVSLIPSSMITNPIFITYGDTGATGATSDTYLYQLLGGGGAGGYSSSIHAGGGGGGSGVYKNGFFNVKNPSTINLISGLGGVFNTSSNNGNSSKILYKYGENTFTFEGKGGSAGSINNDSTGMGGTGFFSGGCGAVAGLNTIKQSNSLTLMPCNSQGTSGVGESANGGGYLGIMYQDGQSNYSAGQSVGLIGIGVGGGGGGGWYGGYGGVVNGTPILIASDALGYGCGGGGGAGDGTNFVNAGNGSVGYALLREFNPGTAATLIRVTNSRTIAPELFGKSGVWAFLAADTGLDALNTLHFSIPYDGLKSIKIVSNDGNFTVYFNFTNLLGYPQIVTRNTLTTQRYINFLIYE